MPNPPDNPGKESPERPAGDGAETARPTPTGSEALRRSALQTSGAILAAQRRAEQELLRANEALAVANAWQRTILDSAEVSIIATDPQGVIQTFNAAAERMLGYDAEEVVGKTTPAIIHDPAEVQRRAAELTHELGRVIEPGFEVFVVKTRSGTPDEQEWTYLRKDGRRFPVRLSVTAMFDAAGRITGFMGIATDLTERNREEERFREVVEAAPNGIVVVNEAGVITLVNAQTEKAFGYLRSELVGQPVEMLVPERFHAAHPAHRRSFFADPKGRAMGAGRDLFGRRKDGSEFPLEIGLSPIATREGLVVLAAVVDVTGRKRAEEERERLTRELQLLLESTGEGIYGIDLEGRFTFINRAALSILGFTREELLGRNAHEAIHHTRKDGSAYPVQECPIFRAFHTGQGSRRDDEVLWRKDGTSFSAEYVSYPILQQGVPTGAVVTFSDITERKQAEAALHDLNAALVSQAAELADAKERAEAADRLKSAFLATMSHELRTPLNSIIGFTGIILQGLAGPLNPEQTKQLEMVRGSARHLLALINDVLDISKIEAGQLEVYCEPFDLRASITNVTNTVRPLAEKKGLALNVEVSPAVAEAVSDKRRVEQVLLNLLSNAIKFTEQGGVTFTAEIVPGTIHNPQPAIRIAVADTGMGIKTEDLDQLFQPFRQIDSGLSRNHEGTGLGLAICQRLAEKLGGAIRAESEWGKGSVFTFTLPLGKR